MEGKEQGRHEGRVASWAQKILSREKRNIEDRGRGGQTASIVEMADGLSSQQESEELKTAPICRKKAKAEETI